MQRLEVSGAVRPIYESLGVKQLMLTRVVLIITRLLNHVTYVTYARADPSLRPL